jgi:hypothetical protein
MDNTENFPTPMGPTTTSKPALFSDNRNVLIMLLSLLLLLSVLGVTFINTLFDVVKRGVGVLVSFFGSILGTVFYASGDILNTTTNTVADVAKTSIDLGSGAINDVGNLMKSGVTGDQPPAVPIAPVVVHTAGPTPMVTGAPADLDQAITAATTPPSRMPIEPEPTPPENPIHQPQNSWCFIGAVDGNRTCLKIDPRVEQCASGKIFPSSQLCANP